MNQTMSFGFSFRKIPDVLSIFVFIVLLGAVVRADDRSLRRGKDEQPRQRKFVMTYGASIEGLKQDDQVRIWIPQPQTNEFQTVKVRKSALPAVAKKTRDRKYGNAMIYLEPARISGDKVTFELEYGIVRQEATASGRLGDRQRKQLDLFLQPNKLVPVTGKPIETFSRFLESESIQLSDESIDRGRVFYDFVEEHMKYDKSKPGYGTGNSNWACDSRTGNCTDFHSLFISVARANQVPAQFRIGFPLPTKRGAGSIGGYHCWALFHDSKKGWVPVDISEADKDPTRKEYFYGKLTENRVQFTTGRDLVLEPAQAGSPLNYFVFPYVEVNGQAWPKEKVKMDIRYQDH